MELLEKKYTKLLAIHNEMRKQIEEQQKQLAFFKVPF
jgi:hypothetical protein